MKIGVLAAQGAFIEHIAHLRKLRVEATEIRLPEELDDIDGLILPGGESTTICKLIADYKLRDRLEKMARSGFPIFGTCAGMILLAKDVADANGVQSLGAMSMTVRRNAFGRQTDSFETDLSIPALGKKPFHAVFIRAPLIENVHNGVEVLASLTDGTIVAARQKNLLALSFHPELTEDLRFHQYFVEIVAKH